MIYQKLFSYLTKSRDSFLHKGSAQNIAILTLGTTFAQGATIAATVLLTRLFSPADFGAFALFLSVVAIVSTLVTLRYEVNILIPKTYNEAENLLFLSLTLAILVGCFIVISALALPYELQKFVGLGALRSWLPLACIIGIVVALTTTTCAWLNRCQRYLEIAQIKIMQSVAFAIIALIFGYYSYDSGLLVAQAISAVAVLSLAVRYLPKPSYERFRSGLTAAKPFSVSPKYMLPTAMLDVITLQIPLVLISLWYGASDAGQFSLAWRVLVLPASLIGLAVSQVFYQRFSVAWPDKSAARSLLTRTWKALALFGLLPLVVMIFAGRILFIYVFGPNWADAGMMASVLAPMLFVSLLHSPTSTTSIVLGLQKHVLLLSFIVLVYRPLSIYIGWVFNDIFLGLQIYCALEIIQMLFFQYLVLNKISSHSISRERKL